MGGGSSVSRDKGPLPKILKGRERPDPEKVGEKLCSKLYEGVNGRRPNKT